jgi:opacity protein-like surface antigen
MLALCTTLALLSPAPAPVPTIEPPALSALSALYAPSAEAEHSRFSYTYLQLGYAVTDLDTIDDDAKGLTGRASLGLLNILYIFLDYTNQTTDFQDSSSDAFGLGAGVHFPLTPDLDVLGEAAWLSNDIASDLSTLNDSNTGWTAMAGARWMPLPWEGGGLELDGGYRWIDLKSLLSDDTTGAWEVGARAHFLKMFSVGAAYTFLDQDRQWGVNARVSF